MLISQQLTLAFGEVADDVARKKKTPYLLTDLPPDEDGKKAYVMLYSVIVGCIQNTPLRLTMETERRDVREALRTLDAEYKSTYRGRQMALLKRIMHPHLNNADSVKECIDKLSEWQKVARENERISREGHKLTWTLAESAKGKRPAHRQEREQRDGQRRQGQKSDQRERQRKEPRVQTQ